MTTIVEKIVSGEIEAVVIHRDEHTIAFMDHDPINRGHVLICPIKPYHSFIDLPDEVLINIQKVSQIIYQRIEKKYAPSGISFIQNNGDCNELDHYHLHIFPRFENDGFGWTSDDIGIQTTAELLEDSKGLAD